MNKAQYTNFGKTVVLPIEVWLNNKKLSIATEWDTTLYIDRPEDWYALMSDSLKYKRVRVVKSEDFKKALYELS